MLCDKNELLESRNFIDGVDFTMLDPCIFVVFPVGASGDLLLSIIDKHYLRTGCQYYGIDNDGKVHFYSTDCEHIDNMMNEYDGRYQLKTQNFDQNGIIMTRPPIKVDTQTFKFDQQFLWDLAGQLGARQLNYSILDQMLFGCHQCNDQQVQNILDSFPKAQVIRILPNDMIGSDIIFKMQIKKLKPEAQIKEHPAHIRFDHPRVLELPFGAWFNEEGYYNVYDKIINFLNLKGRLIHWDYVKYYISKQDKDFAKQLIEYSYTLDV